MKLLLLEAPAERRASLDRELREFGYTIDRAVDGGQAVERAAQHDYDVIVLDLSLPRDESLPVLHQIRESNREVEILVLSTRDQIRDRVTALIQGADDYLVKPVCGADLHARIQQLTSAACNPSPFAAGIGRRRPRSGRPDFRIGELLRFCERGEIELVISEVPLAPLLQRIQAGLEATALARQVDLLLPQKPLPTLLVDAAWIEQLLAHLIFNVMINGKPGDHVELEVSGNGENCRIDIESNAACACDLSLAERFANHLNLRVDSSGSDREGFRIGIGGLKIR